MPPVGVVIVSWNVRDLLRDALASLAASTTAARVVVVDNASSDGSAAMVAADFPAVTLVANAVNRGFTAANNQGFRALGVDVDARRAGEGAPRHVLLLNPDTVVAPDAIAILAAYLDAHPGVGAVGPCLLNPDGSVQSSRRRFPTLLTGLVESTPVGWHWPGSPAARRYHMADAPAGMATGAGADAAGPVDWVTGAAILARADALAAVGGFDEGFFMYAEEIDLCRRLRDAGWATHYCGAAQVTHHEGKSSEQAVAARHVRFHRSRVRYFWKHHGRGAAEVVRWGILAAFALEALLEAGKGLAGHRRALRWARVRAYVALLRDGLAPAASDPVRGGVRTPAIVGGAAARVDDAPAADGARR